MTEETLHKKDIIRQLDRKEGSFKKYKNFFVGSLRLADLLVYELAHILASPMPGAPGYVFRKLFMNRLLADAGNGVNMGRNVTLRHPGKITIGNSTAIDDYCLLDAGGVSEGEFNIGSNVLIARDTAISSKTDHGFIDIGDNCTIGKMCILSSSGGIKIGKYVGIADTCYIGGGRYRTNRKDTPMMKQELYTEGPVIIGDDCWIGTGVRVLDGVSIGSGSIIGAGAVVREDVPENTVVTPHQRLIMLPRDTE